MTTSSTPPGAARPDPNRPGPTPTPAPAPAPAPAPSGGSEPAWDAVFTPLTPQDPREISGYLLRARIGEGGMGAVYLSYTPGGRPVALKIARPEFAADPEFRRRFATEVAIAQRVQGLYTAPVIDCDPHAPRPWLATAYVAAPSLAAAVARQGALPPETVLVLLAGVAEALQSIHAAGVIHRDLKPGNVILAADGPRVIDFGISRAVEASSAAITQTGVRIGTPAFMAPEQVRGRSLDAAGDVFSLGSTAYYAVTGEYPFGADAAVFHRIEHQQPDWDRCPEQVRGVLKQCVDKDPAARPTPATLIELCRAASTDERLRIGEGWLPPTVTAEITRYSVAPPKPPQPQHVPRTEPRQPQPPAPSPWVPPRQPAPPNPAHRKPSPWLIGGLGTAALVAVIVLVAALSNRSSDEKTNSGTTTTTSTGTGTGTSATGPASTGPASTGPATATGVPATTAGSGNPTSKPTAAPGNVDRFLTDLGVIESNGEVKAGSVAVSGELFPRSVTLRAYTPSKTDETNN
ncbi:serine/threonine-protein kinase, partial [Frankia sp. Cr1]|uniref:serine/threonine-protein kinase n=1 Tax=Frankia sp. Cr1 TaxID=3073931 RepID=UPI003A100E13